ncbi:unnamed protein product, partial [Callosobruchus maculatus]
DDWSTEHISLLIEIYQQHPCLYGVKYYHSKIKWSAAITAIVKALKPLRSTVTEQEGDPNKNDVLSEVDEEF